MAMILVFISNINWYKDIAFDSWKYSSTTRFTDDETLHTFEVILGITLVNDFEINPFPSCDQDYGYEKKQGPSIRGLFALASMPSHNCVANSSHEFSSR